MNTKKIKREFFYFMVFFLRAKTITTAAIAIATIIATPTGIKYVSATDCACTVAVGAGVVDSEPMVK